MAAQKKEALIKMGGLQQRMPTPMFDRYRQLQGIKDTHPKDIRQDVQNDNKLDFSYLEEDDKNMKCWYKPPEAIISEDNMSGVSLLPQFELGAFCYTTQKNELYRISIPPASESPFILNGFNCEKEQSVFGKILNEANEVFDKIIKCVS